MADSLTMKSDREAFDLHLDTLPIRGKLLLVPILCMMSMVIEGIDSNVISYVGPLIKQELALTGPALGLIYSATVIAALIGAAGVAPLSDHFGRRPVMLWATLILAVATLVTPSLTTAWELFAIRFVVGIAFGAAVPTTFALTADYSPPRRRAFLIMMVTAGVALGYVAAGYASALIIPHWGWRTLMYLAGCVSFGWGIMLYFLLPESPLFAKGGARSRQLLESLGFVGHSPAPATGEEEPAARPRPYPSALFTPGLRWRTLAIWLVVSCAYAAELLVAFWFPAMLLDMHYSIAQAASITATGKIASIFGSALIGLIMDRMGIVRTLSAAFLLTAISFLFLSTAFGAPTLLIPLVFLSYFLLDGSFAGAQALAVTAYPAELRATASGWITGFARLIGGGLGTLAGGAMIDGFSAAHVTMLVAFIMLTAALLQWLGPLRIAGIKAPDAQRVPAEAR